MYMMAPDLLVTKHEEPDLRAAAAALAAFTGSGEHVLSLSLGAGNTGRAFDLETDRRIGEFKFIHWQGGAETIRQNSLFKDLYYMIEYPTTKRKAMYVVGTHYPLKFLKGHRALSSVMSRNRTLWDAFSATYGDTMRTVADYYTLKKDEFSLVDVGPFIPGLTHPEDAIPDSMEQTAATAEDA